MYCANNLVRVILVAAQATHLFGVLEVLEEGGLIPDHTLVDVCGSVREALYLAGFAAEKANHRMSDIVCKLDAGRSAPVEVGANFVGLAFAELDGKEG
jgi:hypothetical protein